MTNFLIGFIFIAILNASLEGRINGSHNLESPTTHNVYIQKIIKELRLYINKISEGLDSIAKPYPETTETSTNSSNSISHDKTNDIDGSGDSYDENDVGEPTTESYLPTLQPPPAPTSKSDKNCVVEKTKTNKTQSAGVKQAKPSKSNHDEHEEIENNINTSIADTKTNRSCHKNGKHNHHPNPTDMKRTSKSYTNNDNFNSIYDLIVLSNIADNQTDQLKISNNNNKNTNSSQIESNGMGGNSTGSSSPISIKWTNWSNWSQCSQTCGNGKQFKFRNCLTGNCGAKIEIDEKICENKKC